MRPFFQSCECILFPQAPFFLSCEPPIGAFFSIPNTPPPKFPSRFCKKLLLGSILPKLGQAHLSFCVRNEVVQNSGSPFWAKKQESEEVGFLSKPPSRPLNNDELADKKSNPEDEVLEDFLKFFKKRDTLQEQENEIEKTVEETQKEKVIVEYYEPKPGDFVMGVVVSGNENKLDVNVGADMLGTMLTKEVLPLYEKEMDFLLCDDVGKGSNEFVAKGKMGILKNDEALSGESMRGRPVVESGTVVFAEVLGRTLSGRPLLSTRRFFKRLAWRRVRQIKQLNEPLLVKITEWNTGGLLTRIEGLRAFIPKIELMSKVNNYTDLKENVGRWLRVLISRMNEDTNELILSEKEAWVMLHLEPGSLLDGTVKNIFPYGAQIRIGDTNRSGLLHVSKITQERIASVSDVLAVNEKVKVMVIPSVFPDKISLSIADLESEPGLFLSNKEKVYAEAVTMAKRYKLKMWAAPRTQTTEPLSSDALHFVDDDNFFANRKWFEFERDNEPSTDLSRVRPFYPAFGSVLLVAFALFMCAREHTARKWRKWRAAACYGYDGENDDPVIQLNPAQGIHHEGFHVFGEVDDESAVTYSTGEGKMLWKKNIIMGGKCQLPDFSGVIIYDTQGKIVPSAANNLQQPPRALLSHGNTLLQPPRDLRSHGNMAGHQIAYDGSI